MNRNLHLNIFSFFSESSSEPIIENNLSRALAITLQHDPVFLTYLLDRIMSPGERESLFVEEGIDEPLNITIQLRLSDLDGFEKVIGVTLTTTHFSEEELSRTDLDEATDSITDIAILYKDLCIIIEVKRTSEDCIAQLNAQLHIITGGKEDVSVTKRSMTWSDIIDIGLKVMNFRASTSSPNPFLNQFISFLKARYPQWFPVRFLCETPYPKVDDSPHFYSIQKRLDQIKQQISDFPLYETGKRSNIPVDWGWASEVAIEPSWKAKLPYIFIKVWPGDTKAQGNIIFSEQTPHWFYDKSLHIDDFSFPVTVSPYLKFSHFNRGICWLNIQKTAYGLVNRELFNTLAGKWKRDTWLRLDEIMGTLDPHWKKSTGWNDYFENSNRTYVTISIGAEYKVSIAYDIARDCDENQVNGLLSLLTKCLHRIKEQIEQ